MISADDRPPFDATPDRCERCGASLREPAMIDAYFSRFDAAVLCRGCRDDERHAPGYAAALAAEAAAMRAGNHNFTGAGLTDADRAVLAGRRAARDADAEPDPRKP